MHRSIVLIDVIDLHIDRCRLNKEQQWACMTGYQDEYRVSTSNYVISSTTSFTYEHVVLYFTQFKIIVWKLTHKNSSYIAREIYCYRFWKSSHALDLDLSHVIKKLSLFKKGALVIEVKIGGL